MCRSPLRPSQTSTRNLLRILHTITGLDLRDGGPARSVPSLAQAQASLGNQVTVAATSGQANVPEDEWPLAHLQYFSRGWPQLAGRSSALARYVNTADADLIQHHGLWHRTLHYAWRKQQQSSIPLIITPRGMMMPWAWQHHRTRKRIAQRLLHPRALAAADAWHATSDSEAEAIRDLGFRQPICISPNGVSLPGEATLVSAREYWFEQDSSLEQHRVALFYSRFHAKKRVLECIDLWNEIAPPDWRLLVVGIPDQFSIEDVRQYALGVGASRKVSIYDGLHRPAPFAVAELLLFPSWSENFGMVVAEALAAGIPAAVTHGSPWEGLRTQQAGWHASWDDYGDVIREAVTMSAPALHELGRNGRDWMGREYSWARSAEMLNAFYFKLTS